MAKPRDNPIEGLAINMGGQAFIVPAMTLPIIKRYMQRLEELQKTKDTSVDEYWALQYETIHAAMRRNYPDLTMDELYELVDMNNLVDVFKAIAGKSGLLLGEALGGAMLALRQSTGATSTPTSPPAPAGAGETLTT